MAMIRHPEEGMVFACPECDQAGDVYERDPEAISSRRLDDMPYRCHSCGASFEEPVEREAKGAAGGPGGNYSDAAKAALEADPDDFGTVIPDA